MSSDPPLSCLESLSLVTTVDTFHAFFSFLGLGKELSWAVGGGGHFLECIQLASVAKECLSPAFVSYNSSDTPGGLGIGTWLPLFVRRDPICPREPWEHLEDEGEATRHME